MSSPIPALMYTGFFNRKDGVDCNTCAMLNITEKEQDYEVAHGASPTPHRCIYYDERVYHRANSTIHSSWIFPCEECDNRRHIAYELR